MPPSPSLVSSLGALTILVVEFTTTWNRLPQARLAQRGLEQQRRGSSAEGNHLSRVSHHASPLAWKSVPALTLANIFYCEKLVGSPALALEGCEAPTRAPCCRWLTTGTHCLFILTQRTCLCGVGGSVALAQRAVCDLCRDSISFRTRICNVGLLRALFLHVDKHVPICARSCFFHSLSSRCVY
jgi:hypothetical protein